MVAKPGFKKGNTIVIEGDTATILITHRDGSYSRIHGIAQEENGNKERHDKGFEFVTPIISSFRYN